MNPYSNLTLEQTTLIDLGNKKASFDALNKYELMQLYKTNRHKFYRRWCCRWCGHELSFNTCYRDGKAKDFCNFTCIRRFHYFNDRINGKKAPTTINASLVKEFIEHCRVKMIFRYPAEKLNEELKLVCRQIKSEIHAIAVKNRKLTKAKHSQ